MLKLSIDEFIQQSKNDDTKYLFEYDMDIAWEDNDLGKDAGKLNEAYKTENVEEFISIYNKHYSTDIFNIHLIKEMKSFGGAWPYVVIKSIKSMTIKEFVSQWESENKYCNIDDYIGTITLYTYNE